MTAHRPTASPRQVRPDYEADQARAYRGTLLRYPLRKPLGNPLWCPTPSGMVNLLVRPQIRASVASSRPSSLLINVERMSVEEEIVESGGPAPSATGGRRPAGGRVREREGRG